MNEQVKASAKLAREFLGMIAEGIGKVESGAGEFTRSHAARLARQLPAQWRGGGNSNLARNLLVAGVVASTAALIYAQARGRRKAGRRKGH